ncbi:TPA: LOW QUALITY PROTEIN: hypothetical protein N0F65_009310 [Lagenidium giganteum]|uniref:OTU domain-containing protein n=1 Tax=Lagenidium giganteum TaxID=4803 RepID=A0AAV2YXH6_9STRA|nr:TPA: LOW QUALITY PROTEIN: hypothetical protein N0F65_009310 [Lagenidium giganteum]
MRICEWSRQEGESAAAKTPDDNEHEYDPAELLQVRKLLASLGCKLLEVEADGNCLFRALSDQLHGTQEHHTEIRKRIVSYIESRRDEFEPFMEDEEKFEHYCKRMREDATWGGNQEIYAAARLFAVDVVVHQVTSRVVIECESTPRLVVHLCYHGTDHYDSIRMLHDTDVMAPPQPIELDVEGFRPEDWKKRWKQRSANTAPGTLQESAIATSTTASSNDDDDDHIALAARSMQQLTLSHAPRSKKEPQENGCEIDNQWGKYDAPKLLRHVMGLDQEWTSRLQIVRHYRRLEWRIVRVQADGNCLFRALSDQLYGSEIFHEDVRKRVVGYIEREARFFQPFVENEKAVETVAQYCRRMSRDGEWGGNPELFAAARLFTIELVIHQGPMRRLRITSESDVAPCRTLHLLYRDHHYDSLHDKDEGHEQSTSGSTGPTATVTSAESAQHDTPSLTDTSASDDSTTTTLMSTETKKKKKKKVVTFLGAEMQPDKAEIPQDVPVAFPKRTYFADGRAVPKSFSRRRSPGASTTAPPPSRTRSNPSSLKSDDPALQRTSSQPRILYPHRACFHNGRPMSGRTR